jgi:hypothetical protein
MTPAPRQLKRTAYHEAGHAVVAVLMGVPFQRVTVRPDAQFAGQVVLDRKEPPARVSPWNPDWDVKAARPYWAGRICAVLAGALEETIHTRCWQQQPTSDEGSDECQARVIADYFHPPAKADRWVNTLRFSTLEKLRRPDVQAAVEAIARELVKHKTLNGSRVHFLVEQVRPCGARTKTRNG